MQWRSPHLIGGGRVDGRPRERERGRRVVRGKKVTRVPNRAAKGMPTVMSGPKKSPRLSAGMLSCLRLLTGEGVLMASGDVDRVGRLVVGVDEGM
jgi:hypothetical protein